MQRTEYSSGDRVPNSGDYEELNVFGSWTGRIAQMTEGDRFPAGPRGFTWRPLSERSAAELRAQAVEYRRMAETARTPTALSGLLKLADRLDALADQREREEGTGER
ncbi:MAG TPA: hypothetical protein VME47_16850 [Acetobacteraceae bacterium]|nr:hypothetical protein [Acetobacteraceae bacterium]